LFTISNYGQNSELILDGELCIQIETAIDYLKADKDLNTRNFRFGSTINNGSLYEFYFPTEYVAYQLGIKKEEVFKFDKTKTYPIYKKLEEIKHKTSELKLGCVKSKRKPNIKLSKLDKDNLLINITTNRVGKQGSSGTAYLFFFENGKIKKVYKEYWIE